MTRLAPAASAPPGIARRSGAPQVTPAGIAGAPRARARALPPCGTCPVCPAVFCGALTEEERPRLHPVVAEAWVAPRQAIIREGGAAESVFNVTKGVVKAFRQLPDGRRQIVAFLFPGDSLGFAFDTRYACSAEAITEVRICRFSREGLHALLGAHPHLERRLLAIAGAELVAARDHLLLLGRLTARERVASFLLSMAKRGMTHGEAASQVHLPMGRADIADYLGMTTETVSRTFSELQREGLVSRDRHDAVSIPSVDRLRDLAPRP